MQYPYRTTAPERLLTPLGGLVFAVTLTLVAFWLPLVTLLSRL
jgi:heme/copper-type cytochrome/quinol oxidase subunit 4